MTHATETGGDVGAYRAAVDPLHRNTWPIHRGDDETVIGYLTEHITVNFDAPEPPPAATVWSWKFDDAELARFPDAVAAFAAAATEARPTYGTWREALDVFGQVHQIALTYRGLGQL